MESQAPVPKRLLHHSDVAFLLSLSCVRERVRCAALLGLALVASMKLATILYFAHITVTAPFLADPTKTKTHFVVRVQSIESLPA